MRAGTYGKIAAVLLTAGFLCAVPGGRVQAAAGDAAVTQTAQEQQTAADTQAAAGTAEGTTAAAEAEEDAQSPSTSHPVLTADERNSMGQLYTATQAQYKIAAAAKEAERLSKKIKPSVLSVRPDGSGDYTTIQAAVDAAYNGDVIEIAPGVYHENVKNCYKTLALIGMGSSPADVVLEGAGNDYFHAPLDMGTGILRNMTIHGVDDGSGTDRLMSYAMHCDFESEEDSTFEVENVTFINDLNTAVGVGTKLHYTVTFNNCRFETRTDAPALFLHDFEPGMTYNEPGTQHVIITGCSFRSGGTNSPAIVMESQERCEGAADVTFIGNTLEDTAPAAGSGSGSSQNTFETGSRRIRTALSSASSAKSSQEDRKGTEETADTRTEKDTIGTVGADDADDKEDGGYTYVAPLFAMQRAEDRLLTGVNYCGSSDWILNGISRANNVAQLNAPSGKPGRNKNKTTAGLQQAATAKE